MSLSSKYDTVVTALKIITVITMDVVKARLLNEELKLKSKVSDSNEVVFNATFGRRCYKCRSLNHFQAHQWPKTSKDENQGNLELTISRGAEVY